MAASGLAMLGEVSLLQRIAAMMPMVWALVMRPIFAHSCYGVQKIPCPPGSGVPLCLQGFREDYSGPILSMCFQEFAGA